MFPLQRLAGVYVFASGFHMCSYKVGTCANEQVTGEPVAAPALAAWTYLADFAHSLEASSKEDSHVG